MFENTHNVLLALSLFGFLNSFVLYVQYRRYLKTQQKMFCLFGDDCSEVVASDYGKTFGIKNELIGMLYYSLLAEAALLTPPSHSLANILIFAISSVAALHSTRLLYYQIVTLKNYCSWCLIAIVVNFAIFSVAAMTLLN